MAGSALFYIVMLLPLCVWVPTLADEMSREAQQILLDILQDMGKNMSDVKKCTPAYRIDLPTNKPALYVVEMKKFFFIMSAGRFTGLQDLMVESKPPSPIKVMNKMAKKNGAACVKYFLLTVLGEMVCEDTNGRIVAHNLAEDTLKQLNGSDIISVENHIRTNTDFFKAYWKEHVASLKKEIEEEKEKQDKDGDADKQKTRLKVPSSNKQRSIDSMTIRPIYPGKSVAVALGKADDMKSVLIRFMQLESDSDDEAVLMQKKLCSVITDCKMEDGKGVILSSAFTKDDMGDSYFFLKVAENAEDVLGQREVIFEVFIRETDGSLHYQVLFESPKAKRGYYQYRSWSGFTYYTIKSWRMFPNYGQFRYGRSPCNVGCGPVAWAMIFGYLDRWPSRGSTGLYRSGWNGVYGSASIKAPARNDWRMNNYIIYLSWLLQTSCGDTYVVKMDYIEKFYKDRQTYRNPRVVQQRTASKVKEFTVSHVKLGWPTITVFKTSSNQWHAPVAISVRLRYRRYRYCWWTLCLGWRRQTDTDVYLNMGWHGSSNGWYNFQSHFAIAAVY